MGVLCLQLRFLCLFSTALSLELTGCLCFPFLLPNEKKRGRMSKAGQEGSIALRRHHDESVLYFVRGLIIPSFAHDLKLSTDVGLDNVGH